jgi:hypothetical protein
LGSGEGGLEQSLSHFAIASFADPRLSMYGCPRPVLDRIQPAQVDKLLPVDVGYFRNSESSVSAVIGPMPGTDNSTSRRFVASVSATTAD